MDKPKDSVPDKIIKALDSLYQKIPERIQFGTRAMLAGVVLLAYGSLKLAERNQRYDHVHRATAALEKIDAENRVDFFDTTVEDNRTISLLSLRSADDKLIAELMSKHSAFVDIVEQFCIDKGDLSEESFRHIANMDALQYLAFDDGSQITLEELRPLLASKSLQYLCVNNAQFSERELRKALPNVGCSIRAYADPYPWKIMLERQYLKEKDMPPVDLR